MRGRSLGGGGGGNGNSTFNQQARASGVGGVTNPGTTGRTNFDGVANTGSGGGGATHPGQMPAGAGGSGIVIIRYLT